MAGLGRGAAHLPYFPHYTVVSFFQGPVRIFPVLSDVYRSPSCRPPFRIPF